MGYTCKYCNNLDHLTACTWKILWYCDTSDRITSITVACVRVGLHFEAQVLKQTYLLTAFLYFLRYVAYLYTSLGFSSYLKILAGISDFFSLIFMLEEQNKKSHETTLNVKTLTHSVSFGKNFHSSNIKYRYTYLL